MICKKHEYGQHIKLSCKNHPQLRWSTKNIDGIGCRTIFFIGEVGKPKYSAEECECSPQLLYHVCEIESI